jgi:hypothetical protein
MQRSLVEEKRQSARNLMFWLGAAYLVVCDHAMTPYTFQLDDIKITLVHLLGPVLILAYLVLLALRRVDPPRPIYFIPLMLYMVVMVASTLGAAPYAHWVGWQTTLDQWTLLGPFLAFMVASSDRKGAMRCMALFALILTSSVLFGLAHRLGFKG